MTTIVSSPSMYEQEQRRRSSSSTSLFQQHSGCDDSSATPPTTTIAEQYTGKGTVWTFWDGNPPELVLRCIESMRQFNPHRPVVVVSKATLPLFLDEREDYPSFFVKDTATTTPRQLRPGTSNDFSSPQYLSDWVRLTLLEKYGGIWMDASVICTGPVEGWIEDASSNDNGHNKISMFPMHANSNIHGNWTMASLQPGHPLIRAWRSEFARVLLETGPRQVPLAYCRQTFVQYPALVELWNNPSPPPLPYLWVYLVLQVVLQQDPLLHDTIHLQSSIHGPMYRRYRYNIQEGITDPQQLSEYVAEDLATRPLSASSHDGNFIKLVGSDRAPCQRRLAQGDFVPGSVLDFVSTRFPPRPILYGCNLQSQAPTFEHSRRRSLVVADNLVRFRAAVHCILAAQKLLTETCRPQAQPTRLLLSNVQRRASQTLIVPPAI